MKSRNIGALAGALCLALTIVTYVEATQHSSEQIRIEYVPPKDPGHEPGQFYQRSIFSGAEVRRHQLFISSESMGRLA